MDDIIGEDIPMKDRNRDDQREQREQEEREGQDLDDREQETDFGGRDTHEDTTYLDNNPSTSKYPHTDGDLPGPFDSTNVNALTAVDKFIQDNYNGLRINQRSLEALGICNRIEISGNGNILYRRRGSGGSNIFLKPKVVLNRTQTNTEAVEEFKSYIDIMIKEAKDFAETRFNMPMVNTTPERDTDLPGLTPQENRELQGSLMPNLHVLSETRNQTLEIQADHFTSLLEHSE